MPFHFQPWKFVLAALGELVRKEQEKAIEYIQLENQILSEKLGGNRFLLNHDRRRRLAVKGKALGRQQLKKIATVAQPDTILRWHRELVELNTYKEEYVERVKKVLLTPTHDAHRPLAVFGGDLLGRLGSLR